MPDVQCIRDKRWTHCREETKRLCVGVGVSGVWGRMRMEGCSGKQHRSESAPDLLGARESDVSRPPRLSSRSVAVNLITQLELLKSRRQPVNHHWGPGA